MLTTCPDLLAIMSGRNACYDHDGFHGDCRDDDHDDDLVDHEDNDEDNIYKSQHNIQNILK